MQSTTVHSLFRQEIWTQLLPSQITIPSITLHLTPKDIDYLTDDNTNPNIQQFSLKNEVEKALKTLGGSVFAKFACRTPKDLNILDKKITSVKGLVMQVKLSQYITEALCQQSEGGELILRSYIPEMESQNNQYRCYSLGGNLVGICQKSPAFLSETITINQIQRIQGVQKIINEKLTVNHDKNNIFEQKIIDFVFDAFCSENGNKFLLLSVQPFHIHSLSLFTQEELKKHRISNSIKPKVKIVLQENQLKKADLSQYQTGNELKHLSNVKQWVQFLEKQQKI